MNDPNDTNKPLEEGLLEENREMAETLTAEQPCEIVENDSAEENMPDSENVEVVAEETVAYIPKETQEEVVKRLKEMVEEGDVSDKQELDALKQNFYKLHRTRQEEALATFVEAGGAAEEFVPEHDPIEDEYKETMARIKAMRTEIMEKQEAEREENLQKKLAIIERLKGICEGVIDSNAYNEVKLLQQEWNDIKNVPAGKVNELWKTYQLCRDNFYDLLKLNNEFREYDFKKNLEVKTRLCEEAEQLAAENDVVAAFRQLQNLHQEYREAGPVPKELREELWIRFKNASTEINRRHQAHFENLKLAEQNNMEQKTAICELVETVDFEKLTSFAAWDEKTKEILALQAKWKTIGFAPQKMNVKIFERFRQACDLFFNKKAEFYRQLRDTMNGNLERKKALCEQAESLKDSTDWKATSDKLARLQKEWKTIGAVPHKQSDAVWKRFIAACDYFFEQKGKATSSQRSVERENLEKKREVIARLVALNTDEVAEDAAKQVRALMQEWNAIGHVPFKEKDHVYKEYRAAVDVLYEKFNISASQKNLDKFRSNLGNSGNSLSREREKLMRSYEMKKNEIQTYENNIGFLTSSSKKGNSLVAEMGRKIDKLKADLQLIVDKIQVIDEQEND